MPIVALWMEKDVMAKQGQGILDGYRGTVGPVIGYQWRGRWCLRARPRHVSNPQTVAQQAHRMRFRDMVQLAGRMNRALRLGLRAASLEEGMTECNLFVKMNKDCFTPEGVDYERLVVSRGPVAPVAFMQVELGDDMVLRTVFEKNPLRMRADAEDEVRVWAFCPALQCGVLSAPVFRRSKRLEMALPDEWAGLDVHFYAFVTDYAQRASETIFLEGVRGGEEGVQRSAKECEKCKQGVQGVQGSARSANKECKGVRGVQARECRECEECKTIESSGTGCDLTARGCDVDRG